MARSLLALAVLAGCVLVAGCSKPDDTLKRLGARIVYHNDGQIKEIHLRESDVTDADLAALRGMRSLWMLNLHRTRITDAGLRHISTLTELRGLNLALTHVTDAGLPNLDGLTKLQGLVLDNTDCTPEGIARLQARLPRTKIWFNE